MVDTNRVFSRTWNRSRRCMLESDWLRLYVAKSCERGLSKELQNRWARIREHGPLRRRLIIGLTSYYHIPISSELNAEELFHACSGQERSPRRMLGSLQLVRDCGQEPYPRRRSLADPCSATLYQVSDPATQSFLGARSVRTANKRLRYIAPPKFFRNIG